MDIVVRTPHGDADVSIGGHDTTTTLGELVGAITGQAAPRLALVDGRAVDCSCPLDDADLLVGSVVTTEPTLPVPTSPEDVDVVQVTGHGAGRIVRLGPGQYRIGPGRRSTAEELDLAPVDRPTIDLVIESTAATREVTVVPLHPDVELDGTSVSSATAWRDETLTVGPRAFRLETPTSTLDGERDGQRSGTERRVDARVGTVEFSRPPRRRDPPRRYPVVTALRDATSSSPWLWERRPHHADAFTLTFGLLPALGSGEANANADLDLTSETGVAIVGSEEYRSCLARTLVVEAVTLHGPADLDLAVLTSPDRTGDWDWAKWLPHLRAGGPPAILGAEHEIERWAQQVDGRSRRWTSPHLTLAILDEPGLWRRHESPLRGLLSGPPADVKVIALCDDASHAPAICSAMISETGSGRARFHSFTRDADLEDIRPSLTETGVAVRVARALAPLADVELPPTPAATPIEHVSLDELLGNADDAVARWTTDARRPTVTVGRRDGRPVEVSATDDVTIVVGTSMNEAFAVAGPFVLQQCIDTQPDALWVLPLIVIDRERSDLWWDLPHATERHDSSTPIEPDRLLARIRAVLSDEHGPDRILMILEDSRLSPASPGDDLLDALVRAARTTDGLGVLIVTDRRDGRTPVAPESVDAETVIRIERPHGTGGGRRATAITGDGGPGEPFTPPEPVDIDSSGLEILPLVVGRPLTSLERWIEHEQARAGGAVDPALRAAVDSLRRAVRSKPPSVGGPRRVLVPPPLPDHVGLEELFGSSPGDGVPLGLGDDPGTGELRPRWWQPGQGSLLAFGSRRSGIEQVPTLITLGLIDRFARDDVRLVVIEPSASRRRALDAIDDAPVVRSVDQSDDLARTLDEIEAELDRVAGAGPAASPDPPRLVVVVADLALLRRHVAADALGSRIDAVFERAARDDSGVDVIAYAGDLDGAGPFGEVASQRLVGASSDLDDLARLGVHSASDLEGVAGRCRWFPSGELVQLALPDEELETMLDRRSTGGTT